MHRHLSFINIPLAYSADQYLYIRSAHWHCSGQNIFIAQQRSLPLLSSQCFKPEVRESALEQDCQDLVFGTVYKAPRLGVAPCAAR